MSIIKKEYSNVEIEITNFNAPDVILASAQDAPEDLVGDAWGNGDSLFD